jgi:deoxyribodipyrimidine photo-lyase
VVAIIWFRRDLRVHDHPALRAGLDAHEQVVPAFCLDDRLLRGPHASGARTQFLLECLTDLDRQLAVRGGGLVVRHGPPEIELPALARETGATEVHVTADGSPYDRWRGDRVAAALAAAGAVLHSHPGQHAADDPSAIRTGPGRPCTVFTPYFRNWERAPRRPPLAAPDRVRLPDGLRTGAMPALRDLGLTAELSPPARGGETAGIARLDLFLAAGVRGYAESRSLAGPGSSSRLSPYLRFGCLSARAVEAQLPSGEGAAAFRRQLCWRDFYHQLLACFPGNAQEEFQERYRGRLAWNADEQGYPAWTQGRTGFPLVDAGLRQLRQEGWLPGPVRLAAACFLVKDLGIDWRQGEAWFMRLLLDGDEAVNNGNWQWIASVGTDRQPVSRRIYNPARQQQRQDPQGRYVRAYLPELTRVPWEYLSEPWRMPREVQRKAGCRIGRDYPAPIVDHQGARLAALARYQSAREPAGEGGRMRAGQGG